MPVAVISGGAVSFAKAAVSKTALARRPTSRTAIRMVSGSWLDGRLGNEVGEHGRGRAPAQGGDSRGSSVAAGYRGRPFHRPGSNFDRERQAGRAGRNGHRREVRAGRAEETEAPGGAG